MKKRLVSSLLAAVLCISMVLTGCSGASDDDTDKDSDEEVVASYKYDDDNIFGLKKIVITEDEIEIQFNARKADQNGYMPFSIIKDDSDSCLLKDKDDNDYQVEFECRKTGSKYVLTASLEDSFVPDYFYFHEAVIKGFKKPTLFYRMWGGECANTFEQEYDGDSWSEVKENLESYPLTDDPEHEEETVKEYTTFDSLITEDWQREYIEVLNNYRNYRSSNEHNSFSAEDNDIYGYWLYDIDGNGIPELFARIGNCEANFFDEVYSIVDGKASMVGELPGGHASYYGEPEEGILLGTGHMGYQAVYQVHLTEDNQITMTCIFEEDINGDPEADYTPMADIVEGSYYLTRHCWCLDLPVAAAANNHIITADPVMNNGEVEKLLRDTVYNNGSVTGCQVEHFRKVLPEMDFNTFLEGGNIDEYDDEKDEITGMDYFDMNGDGQNEALLKTKNNTVVVLSYQSGKVFAYVSNYCYASDIVGFGDGYIDFNTDYNKFKLSFVFFEDQVYEEYTYY